MAHEFADGSQEQRPRTDEEIAKIAEENRIAAQINKRESNRRKQRAAEQAVPCGNQLYQVEGGWAKCRRSGTDQRATLSSFERNFLMESLSCDS